MSCNCKQKSEYKESTTEVGKIINDALSGKLKHRLYKEKILAYLYGKSNIDILQVECISNLSDECLDSKIIELEKLT